MLELVDIGTDKSKKEKKMALFNWSDWKCVYDITISERFDTSVEYIDFI